jgi:hypothetical protein
MHPVAARRFRMSTSAALAAAAVGLAAALIAPPAVAGGVHWSVNVQLPPVGVVVGRPVHVPAPVVYAPAPVYAPRHVVYAPPPAVVYAPPPRVVHAPVVVGHGYAHPHGHRRGHWKDRDRDGIPDRWDRHPGWGGGYGHQAPPPAVVYRGW